MKTLSWCLTCLFIIMIGGLYAPRIYENHIKLENIEKINNETLDELNNSYNEMAKLDKKIASLNDEFTREKIARNKLSMVKEDEKIYRYIKTTQEEK